LDASTTWERPPDPDSADLNAPLKITQQEAAAAPGLAMAVAANSAGAGPQSVAGTFAVKKTTSTSSSSGVLLETGATLAPPSVNVAGTGVFSDYHKFVTQYADSDTKAELGEAEKDEPRRRRHRRHLEARAAMLQDIRKTDHRSRLRTSKGGGGGDKRSSASANSGSRSSAGRGRGGAASGRNDDFQRRAGNIAAALGGGSNNTAAVVQEKEKLQEERKQLNKLVESTENTLEAVKKQLKRAQEENDALKNENKTLSKELSEAKKDNDKLKTKVAEAKDGKKGSSGDKSDKYKADAKKYKEELESAKKKIKRLEEDKKHLEKSLAAVSAGLGGQQVPDMVVPEPFVEEEGQAPAEENEDYDD